MRQVLYIVVTQFNADGPANNHAVVFEEYARSRSWTVDHIGQLVAMGILLAGRSPRFTPWTVRMDWRDGRVDSVPVRRTFEVSFSTPAIHGPRAVIQGMPRSRHRSSHSRRWMFLADTSAHRATLTSVKGSVHDA